MQPRQNAINDDLLPKRPVCPTCAVPMWLNKIVSDHSGNRLQDRYHFECKVCDSMAVVPSLED